MDQSKYGTGERAIPTPIAQSNLERTAGYKVYDVENNQIGKVNAIWTDHKDQPAFLGVRTSWLTGKTHVVPAYDALVNHANEVIRLAYREDDVKNAPNYDPDAELDYNMEQEVFAYYRRLGGRLPETEPSRAARSELRAEHTTQQRSTSEGETRTVPLHEEQMRVGKREVEAGGVRLRKIVRTETVQQPVELKREEIEVERVPGGTQQPSQTAFKGEDIFIPLRREEPVVSKETQVKGGVKAHKTQSTERRTIEGEVRKEDVEVDREGHRKAA